MVGQPLWKNLKLLVEIDKKARRTREKIEEKKKFIIDEKKKIEEYQKQIKKLELKVKEYRKKVDSEELVAKALKDKEEKKQAAIDKTTNEKEYKAILKEIKQVTQERMHLEDLLIQSWHRHDQSKKEFLEFEKQKDKTIQDIKKKIIDEEKNIQKLEALIKQIDLERKESAKNIPEEWLNKYKRMKENVSDPIVPVTQNSCGACYYHVIRQDMQRLKNNGILLCRNCYRFLYFNQEEKKEQESAF